MVVGDWCGFQSSAAIWYSDQSEEATDRTELIRNQMFPRVSERVSEASEGVSGASEAKRSIAE